jgi:hypothetical protein
VVDSASNRKKYEETSWGVKGGRGIRLTAICEPIVYKMWEPRPLTTLWDSTACYRDRFTFFLEEEAFAACLIYYTNTFLEKFGGSYAKV